MDLEKIKQLFINYDELQGIDDQSLRPLIYFGSNHAQRLEFLGDAVLDLVVATLLYDYEILKTPSDLDKIKSKIVNNTSLDCFIKYLCPFQKDKQCADLFEILIGIVYLHTKNNLQFVTKWLIEQWGLIEMIDYIINHPEETNICKALNISVTPKQKVKSPQRMTTKILTTNVNDTLTSTPKSYQTKPQFRVQLENYYNYYKLTKPIKYITINAPTMTNDYWNIGIVCPQNLICEHKIIASGSSKIKHEAEELAAESALTYLIHYLS
jgi:dsRNA-specific ribonuclease